MGNETRDFFIISIGVVFGAIIGGFIAAMLGVIVSALIVAVTHSGEGMTDAGGLIILAIPFGWIAGGLFGLKMSKRYLS